MTGANAPGAERDGGPVAFVPGTTVTVAVATLAEAVSPLRSVDERWVATLVAAGPPFAPVVVNAGGALVDGAHRVRAALVLRIATMPARVVDAGTEAELIAAALEANRRQVKPLTRAERKAAALKLIAAGPDWSDRAVARASGCSHTSVARWRAEATGQSSASVAGSAEPVPPVGGQSTTAPAGGDEPVCRADGQSTTQHECDPWSHHPQSGPGAADVPVATRPDPMGRWVGVDAPRSVRGWLRRLVGWLGRRLRRRPSPTRRRAATNSHAAPRDG